jgi:hypothetical protein
MPRSILALLVLSIPISALAQTEPLQQTPSAQSPIQVTITAPQQSASDVQADRNQRQREMNIQERIANYTGWLVEIAIVQTVITLIAVLAAFWTLIALKQQVNANVDAARTAERQLLAATSPRIYVEGVRVVNFNPDEEPVFFLRIANAGPVQAENVLVFIEVTYRTGGIRPTADGNAILVPANGYRDYDFRPYFKLPANMLKVNGWNLRVSGTVTHDGQRQTFCYKYNPWTGRRPKGVRTFVPCDYDPSRSVSVAITGVSASGAVGNFGAEGGPD